MDKEVEKLLEEVGIVYTREAAPGTMDDIRRYAELSAEKAKLKDRLVQVEAGMKETEPRVLAYFEGNGVDKIRVDGQTLYLRMELWAGRAEGVTNEEAIAALTAAGLGDMASPRINVQTLSAFCRELAKDDKPLPTSFAGKIVTHDVAKVGSRRS